MKLLPIPQEAIEENFKWREWFRQFSTADFQPGYSLDAVSTTASISLTASPQVVIPGTLVKNNGIQYDTSTGVITFTTAGVYPLLMTLNAYASASGQYLYLYSESNKGSGWVANMYSGREEQLVNSDVSQVVICSNTYRAKGEQLRFQMYSNDSKVSLKTITLAGPGVYVPAIRMQFQ